MKTKIAGLVLAASLALSACSSGSTNRDCVDALNRADEISVTHDHMMKSVSAALQAVLANDAATFRQAMDDFDSRSDDMKRVRADYETSKAACLGS